MTHFMFDKMMGEWQTAVTYNVFFSKSKTLFGSALLFALRCRG